MHISTLGDSLIWSLLACNFVVHATPANLHRRQLPPEVNGLKTILTPTGVQIRYKEPGQVGVCETTPGVKSFSGYVDLAPDAHTFFWFFEARHKPAEAPITLWLNGGPGSDSLIGLFQELGPCNITEGLNSQVNPYSWNEVSNLLFISQPLGVGFSYSEQFPGTLNNYTGEREGPDYGVDGRYPVINATELDTTQLAAVATWHVLQGFLSALPQLTPELGNATKQFNLWTESYGGHYGPTFYKYFYEQNQLISNGSISGTPLIFDTLGIGNGIIDQSIQAPYYPEFANYNTYGIKAVNDTVYNYMKFAYYLDGGCRDLLDACKQLNRTTDVGRLYCSHAVNDCQVNVENPYYAYGGRGVYDIRHPYNDSTPPDYFTDYLNQEYVQQALGVTVNHTISNNDIYYAFAASGDEGYPVFIDDLEFLLNSTVRVALFYGDADYICNWFGGEAISNALQFRHTKEFAQTGYTPFVVGGVEYGSVREYGNFSFTRIYEAGHEVPYYQPLASLEYFRRVLGNKDVATGQVELTPTYGTTGPKNSTHTEPFVPLPSSISSSSSSTYGTKSTSSSTSYATSSSTTNTTVLQPY